MKLCVIGRESDGFAKGSDGIVPLFLGNLNVGAETERIEGGGLAGIGAVEFGQRGVVLLLLEEKMDYARLRAGSIGLNREIVAVRGSGLGLLLRVESLR